MTKPGHRRSSGRNWRCAYQARCGSLSFFRARWAWLQEFVSSLSNRQSAIGNRQFSSGFTMLEILAVLLIFMILLGIAMYPASKWHRQQRIRSGVAVVQSALRLAREQAMTRRETVSVLFSNEDHPGSGLTAFYWLQGQASGNLSPTSALPTGVCFFFRTFQSTNGIQHVEDEFRGDPSFHHAVCIAGDPETYGDWSVITIDTIPGMHMGIVFAPDGRAQEPIFHVGLVEASSHTGGNALTGLVAVVGSTGHITSDPASP